MSNIKRFLEDVSVSMGLDGVINDDVLEKAQEIMSQESVSMGLDGVINDDVLEKAHVAKKNELVDKIIPQELKND